MHLPFIRRDKIQKALYEHGESVRAHTERLWREKLRQREDEQETAHMIELEEKNAAIAHLERQIDSMQKDIGRAEKKRLEAARLTKRTRAVAAALVTEIKRVTERDAKSLHEFMKIEALAVQNEQTLLDE